MNMRSSINRQIAGPGGVAELLHIAVPLILSGACDTVMMFTDRLFLAQRSGEEMAAVMGGGLMAFTFQTFFIGMCGYSNAMVANRYGAGQKTRCPVVTTQALLIMVCSYPLMLACIPVGYRIFEFAGIAPVQAAPQRTYFTVLLAGSIIPLLRTCLSNFFSGIGRTRIVLAASLVSMIANVGLNYVLVFGKAGLPALGIFGAGVGTVIAGFLGLAVLGVAYVNSSKLKEYAIRASLRLDKGLMHELWRKGSPTGLEMLLNLVAFTTLVTMFHSCGTAIATAITIAFNWDMVSFVPMIGLNTAVMSLAGRYCGSGELPLVYRSAWSGMKLSAIYSCLLMGLFVSAPGPLVDLFLPVVEADGSYIRDLAIFMVRLICVYVFCDGVLQVFGGALRGAGDTFWVMVVSVIMHWTFALIAIVMLRPLGFDAKTTWVAVIIVFLCYGPIFLVRFISGVWEKQAFRNIISVGADHDPPVIS